MRKTSFIFKVVNETKNRTRIYVFLGTPAALVDMMNAMDNHQLFSKGEYMVIFVDMMTYSIREAQKYLWKVDQINKFNNCQDVTGFSLQKLKSLLVIASSPPSEKYQQFTDQVREYNSKEPFKFTTPSILSKNNFSTFISIYAAYLYDSVILYAHALENLLKNEALERPITPEIIREIASNGTSIISAIIGNKNYESKIFSLF